MAWFDGGADSSSSGDAAACTDWVPAERRKKRIHIIKKKSTNPLVLPACGGEMRRRGIHAVLLHRIRRSLSYAFRLDYEGRVRGLGPRACSEAAARWGNAQAVTQLEYCDRDSWSRSESP